MSEKITTPMPTVFKEKINKISARLDLANKQVESIDEKLDQLLAKIPKEKKPKKVKK